VKFYLDEDLPARVAELLRRRGLDAVSVHEVGNFRFSDREQLAFAARDGRCLVTRDARHFVDLSHEAVRRQTPHAGIIVCPPRIRGFEFGAIAEALIRVAGLYPQGLGDYDVMYL
jgi:predicted nuclease of predicted toxin-antitoxin system